MKAILSLVMALTSTMAMAQTAQPTTPATGSNQLTVQKKHTTLQTNTNSQPTSKKPATSVPQQFVNHGVARDQSTACSTARTDKNGQLDCGMHGKAAKPNPR